MPRRSTNGSTTAISLLKAFMPTLHSRYYDWVYLQGRPIYVLVPVLPSFRVIFSNLNLESS